MQTKFLHVVLFVSLCAAIYLNTWTLAAISIASIGLFGFNLFLERLKVKSTADILKRIEDLEEHARTQSVSKAFR